MKKTMQRVDVIMDLELDYLSEETTTPQQKPKRTNEKTIRISDKIFQQALNKGLIEKTTDGYIFIGKASELRAFKKIKN